MNHHRIALITGATSGIGEATAELLARHNFHLILCGRRKNRLERLEKKIAQHTKTMLLCFDVQNKEEVRIAFEQLDATWRQLDVLINNAGNAHGLSVIQEGNLDDWDAMIDTNIKGLLYVSHKVMPWMTARNKGHIINIGSIAGKETYPKGNIYCSTKSAVDTITRAMRLDLNPHRIKVTAIHPGLVETEFSKVRFKGDEKRAAQSYAQFQPLKAEDIADTILYTLTCPDHVVIADLVVLPTAQASPTVINKSPS